jgi:prepilin-type N-terminal cleavage/methylation domain-containing protein
MKSTHNGFTLIESLVALAILGVIVGILVNVHLQTLRAESFSRQRLGAVMESETVLSQAMLGTDRQVIMDDAGKAGWRVTGTPMGQAMAEGGWCEWRIAASNAGSPVVTMHLRGK